jgi:hypothetical protein
LAEGVEYVTRGVRTRSAKLGAERLSGFFAGHGHDGDEISPGQSSHLAFQRDGRRLLVFTPHRFDQNISPLG